MSWTIAGSELDSRFFIGTALYPSPQIMLDAIRESAASVVTVSLRRQMAGGADNNVFWETLKKAECQLLPNTAGCHSATEAITTAQMAREVFETNWIKLEVIGDDYNLQPDPFELVTAAKALVADGFEVFPYTTDDLVLGQRLLEAGCNLLMPWGAPIGSGRGLANPQALRTLRERLPEVPLIIDAGIGKPSHAAQAMEMGFDGILLNTAVAQAYDPVQMARAFGLAIEAGRAAFQAGTVPERDLAKPSTPVTGTPFWKQHSTPQGSE